MRSCNIRNTVKRDGCLSRIALFYLLMGAVSAFTIIPGREVSGFASNRLTTKSIIGLTASTEEETTTAPKLFDTNDKQFVEGAVVRVIAPLRAFQVNKKWYGSFDEGKSFQQPKHFGIRAYGVKCFKFDNNYNLIFYDGDRVERVCAS